jgi:hypothetical protein
MEYERMILRRQHEGVIVEQEELKTSVDDTAKKDGVYVVDLDGIVQDIVNLEHVNHVPYGRDHIDW